MGIPDHLSCLLRNLCAGHEETELDMEQQTGSKSGKEYVKAVEILQKLNRKRVRVIHKTLSLF